MRWRLRTWFWRVVRPRYEVFVTYGDLIEGALGYAEGITEGGASWEGFYLTEKRARTHAAAIKSNPTERSPQGVYVYALNGDVFLKRQIGMWRVA